MATKRTKKKVVKWQYLGETDPAQFVWSNKTHRSASEAFRDADYATAFWREPTEWEKTREYVKWIALWLATGYFLYALAVWFNEVVG